MAVVVLIRARDSDMLARQVSCEGAVHKDRTSYRLLSWQEDVEASVINWQTRIVAIEHGHRNLRYVHSIPGWACQPVAMGTDLDASIMSDPEAPTNIVTVYQVNPVEAG